MTTALSNFLTPPPADASVTAAKLPASNFDLGGRNLDNVGGANVRVFMQAGTPTAENTGDLWYETDTNIWWFWNGTYWLSCQLFKVDGDGSLGTTGRLCYRIIEIDQAIQHDVYLVDYCAVTHLSGTPGPSDYFNVHVYYQDRDGTQTNMAAHGLSGDTGGDWTIHKTQLDTHVDVSAKRAEATPDFFIFDFYAWEVGDPGTLTAALSVTYRWAHL